jgi:hypothetical protein
MGLNLQLQALTLPSGTEFPGTMQLLENLTAQYLAITGDANFSGINFGPTTPATADQNKPWFRTDGSLHSIGWYAWTGSIWDRVQVLPQTGTLAAAPTAIGTGQLYYATDGAGLCVWNGTAWITADGRQGEVRYVRGATLATILAQYPGWVQVTDAVGCAFAVAGTGSPHGFSDRTPETFLGEEEHTLIGNETPTHSHNVDAAGTAGAAGAQAGSNSAIKQATTLATTSFGGGLAHNNMPPTWFLYAIQKL